MSERSRAGLFVTGTDTGVGKTVVSAALLGRLRTQGRTRYWKPVQTGIEQDDDSTTVGRLSGCAAREIFQAGIRLLRPLSPHQAARLSGTYIHFEDLMTLASAQPSGECWVVEGAGGVLVPLNDHQLMVDLMTALVLPVVVVARTGIGTINHTLLTLEALRARALTIAGVVMVGEPHPDNREAIERYGHTTVVGELPMLDSLTPETLALAAADWRWDVLEALVWPETTTSHSQGAATAHGTNTAIAQSPDETPGRPR
ncbi:MAG: dethiobiotin synthase [Vicinamibacterales bacterium]